MIIKRDLCICGEKQKPKQTNDKFKTIICENCLEVISYEKPKKKKSKSKTKNISESEIIADIRNFIDSNSFQVYYDGRRKIVVDHKMLSEKLTMFIPKK